MRCIIGGVRLPLNRWRQRVIATVWSACNLRVPGNAGDTSAVQCDWNYSAHKMHVTSFHHSRSHVAESIYNDWLTQIQSYIGRNDHPWITDGTCSPTLNGHYENAIRQCNRMSCENVAENLHTKAEWLTHLAATLEVTGSRPGIGDIYEIYFFEWIQSTAQRYSTGLCDNATTHQCVA